MVRIKAEETLDDLLIKDMKIIQKKKGFRVTLDSVLLAHFATVKRKDRIIDLGTGTGVIPLILSTRGEGLEIEAVEIQAEMAEMARRSVELNDLTKTIRIIQGDIRGIHRHLGRGVFTLVTANPPYWTGTKGLISGNKDQAIARHEICCNLEDVIESAVLLLNYSGRFAFIHPADRLLESLLLLRRHRLEPRRLRFIHSRLDKPARFVLLEARKHAPADLQVLAPLVIYEKDGSYSKEVLEWYKEGED